MFVCILIAFLILCYIRVKLFRLFCVCVFVAFLVLCLMFRLVLFALCLEVKIENDKDYRGKTESISLFFIVLFLFVFCLGVKNEREK